MRNDNELGGIQSKLGAEGPTRQGGPMSAGAARPRTGRPPGAASECNSVADRLHHPAADPREPAIRVLLPRERTVPIPPGHDGHARGKGRSWEAVRGRRPLASVDVEGCPKAGTAGLTRGARRAPAPRWAGWGLPGEPQMRFQGAQEPRPDAGNPVQGPARLPNAPQAVPVGHDPPGKGQADPRAAGTAPGRWPGRRQSARPRPGAGRLP